MTSRRLLDPAARTLLDAAVYIDQYGWCQGISRDIFGRVCPWGAIMSVARTRDERHSAQAKMRDHLGIDNIPMWNDRPGRLQAEVTMALRAAALG